MTYLNEPELIETKDWSVWLRFPEKVGQSEVYELLADALTNLSLRPTPEGVSARWEIRPIRRVSAEGGSARGGEERKER